MHVLAARACSVPAPCMLVANSAILTHLTPHSHWHPLHCLQRMDLAPGAPLAPDAPRHLPLIIFSHGLGGNRFLCAGMGAGLLTGC